MQASPAMPNNSVAPAPSEAGAMDGKPKKKGFVGRMLRNRNGWVKRFARQDLPGWSPIITAKMVVLFYLLSALILLPLGGAILAASLNVKEYSVRYDNQGDFKGSEAQSLAAFNRLTISQNGNGVPVVVAVTAKKKMKAPVYVYYQLNAYYQNYRRYVRSVDSKQLGGENSTTSACQPYSNINIPGSPNNGIINPCGLIAHSNFNDSISLLTPPGIVLDESNLAWTFDRHHLYSDHLATNYNDVASVRGGNTSTVPINTDQHLMVWMRVGAHATVRKLYATINTDIAAGTVVTFQVQNRYNTYDYGGAKYVVISTNSWVGGKNNFLGILYLVVGAISLLLSIAFFCVFYLGVIKRRKFADVNELSWNKKRT